MTTAPKLSTERLIHNRKRSARWLRVLIAGVAAIAVIAAIVVGFASFEVTRSVLDIPATEAGSSPAPTWPAPPTAHMATLTTVAQFPARSFLENLVVRNDGSILVTEETRRQLWYLPAPTPGTRERPIALHTFDHRPMGIVETEPNVFYVTTSGPKIFHTTDLYRVDLRNWHPGVRVPVHTVLRFPLTALFLDGSCVIAPNVILETDAGGGAIWRVDLSADGMSAKTRRWLKDPSMALERNSHIKGVPGVNGIRYDAATHTVYYTSTGQKLFMEERVDPKTLNPVGAPQVVAFGSMWDDFAIDTGAGVAYLATHRENTIERVPLDPRNGQELKRTVAGMPFDAGLVGPASFAFGTGPGEYGSVGYVTTDGGATQPPPGRRVAPARVLRVVLTPAGTPRLPLGTTAPGK
jgi:hypothetical protein